jgi:hypothetical protein
MGSDERIDVASLAITARVRLDVWVGARARVAGRARVMAGERD